MRRLLMLLGVGLVGTAAGCCHTSGVCDCEGPPTPCAPYTGQTGLIAPPTTGRPEVIKEMPKPVEKPAPIQDKD
jgi:hypothetical protein